MLSPANVRQFSLISFLILVYATSGWAVSLDDDKFPVTATPDPSESSLTAKAQEEPYVEALITLGKLISLKDVDSLPRAPGSHVKILGRNNKVGVQIPRTIANLLMDNGIKVTVLKEFVLVTDRAMSVGVPQAPLDDACSDTSVEAANTNDLSIPEFDWDFSAINVTDAPVDAQVLCVDVHFEIDHTCVDDVEVDVSNENSSIQVDLKDPSFDFSCAGHYEDTVTGITDFAGEPVNQDWLLWATDVFPGDSGVIDSWWVKIYYTTSDIDPNLGQKTPCSDTNIELANTEDLSIPEDRWAFSTISINEAPIAAQVICLDVHFEIDHSCVSDVEVDLSNEESSVEVDLKEPSLAFSCSDYFEDTITGITDFFGEPVNQDWLLWATDWFSSDTGVIDSWWIKIYYTTSGVKPLSVHDEPNEAIALVEGELYIGTTRGATGDDASECSLDDTQDVWHTFSPDRGGLLVLSTKGSEMDTTLGVYDPCSLSELACSDDVGAFCEGSDDLLWSQIMMPVASGENYLIRVAGFDRSEGNYQILAELYLDELPAEPNQPSPGDGQTNIATHARLQWYSTTDNTPSQVQSTTLFRSINNTLIVITPQTIFGNDDRTEEYDITDADLLTGGGASVVITLKDLLTFDPNSRMYDMTQLYSLAEWYNLAYGYTLCPDEPFRDQPSPGYCSGFLVAPDIIATAGHCVSCPSDCDDMAFVFGFVMADETTPKTSFTEDEVYFCQEVIGFLSGWPDWALVRLDRPVVDVEPVPTRRFGKVPDDQPLMMVGHPYGLPKKYDRGGTVGENEQLAHFEANVDASGGSSGSSVFNLETLEVEGILVAGYGDFDFGEKCDRSITLPDNSPLSAFVTRSTAFSSLIPSYDIYLGTQPDVLERVAEDVVTPYLNVTDLQADTTYYWCAVARNIAGESKSPVWSFRTEP